MGRGEGDAVVRADRLGQAMLLKRALEDGEGVAFLGRREGLAREQIAAGEVRDRQRIAVPPVAQHELALVVGAPEAIGSGRPGQGCAREAPPWSSRPSGDEPMAVEDRMHRADGRTVDLGPALAEALPDLRRAPAGVLALELDDRLLDHHRQLIRVAMGPSAAIGEALHPDLPVPLVNLVACLAGNPELLAQRHHRLALEQTGHKPKSLVHHVTLLPRHGPSSREASVTYVSGIKSHPCLRKDNRKLESWLLRSLP